MNPAQQNIGASQITIDQQLAYQQLTQGLLLTDEERDLVLAHRKEKEAAKERLFNGIHDSLAVAIGDIYQEWRNWPGTQSIARALYSELLMRGIIKE